MKLALPLPTSVNNMYRNVPGRGRVPTGDYQRWQKAAMDAMWTQKWSAVTGPVELIITLEPLRRYDVSNRIKACEDFLVKMGIIADDNHQIVRRVTVQIGDIEGCEIEVRSL